MGTIPTNVGFNGSTFSVSGVAIFRTGETRTGFVHNEDISIGDLDSVSDGLWSLTLNSYSSSLQTQQQPQPKVPAGNSYSQGQMDALRAGFSEALDRLGNAACAALFTDWYDGMVAGVRPNDEAGIANAQELVRDPAAVLRDITFRFLALGAPTRSPSGSYSVIGASTGGRDSVSINSQGPFINRAIAVTGATLTFNFGGRTASLTQSEYSALLLLHELGHAYGYLNGTPSFFGPDAADPSLNMSHTEQVIGACFSELNQSSP